MYVNVYLYWVFIRLFFNVFIYYEFFISIIINIYFIFFVDNIGVSSDQGCENERVMTFGYHVM